MTFHRVAYPFADHAGVRLTHPQQRDRKHALVSEMETAGLSLIYSYLADDHELLFFGTAPERHLSADRSLYAEGYFYEARVLLPDNRALPALVERAPRINGNGTMVTLADGTIKFAADRLGLSQIYCHAHAPQIVTNRIELAVRILESLGCSPSLDTAGAARMLMYATPFWSGTAVAGLSLLPLGTAAILNGRGIQMTEPLRFSAGTGGYRALLLRAAEEISSNVRAIVQSLGEANLVMSLSGGVDSRVLLAAMLAAGVEKQFGFYTYGREDSADRSLARGIRAVFGLREAVRAPAVYYAAEQAFERGFQLNWGMRKLDGNEGFTESEPRDEIIIDGGCGENMRGYFSKLLRRRYGDERLFKMSRHDIREGFLRMLLRSKLVSPRLEKAIRTRARSEIACLSRGDTVTDIDLLYPHYRNRFHIGLGARIRASNALTFSPLCSPAGIASSLAIDPQERAMSRVAYDLICLMCPKLAAIPTTAGPWSDLFARHQQYSELPEGEDSPNVAGPPKPDIAAAAAAVSHGILDNMPLDKRITVGRLTALDRMAGVADPYSGALSPAHAIAIAQFLKTAERLRIPEAIGEWRYSLSILNERFRSLRGRTISSCAALRRVGR